jgi:hypothetical protein
MNHRALNYCTKAKNGLALRFSSEFHGVGWDWVHLVRRPLFGLLYHPRMLHDECGAVGGMRIGKGNRSIRRKPVPVPLCPPQIPHDLNWARTWAAEVGSRWLNAWAMSRPWHCGHFHDLYSGGVWFESWLKVFVVSLFYPDKCQKCTSIRS